MSYRPHKPREGGQAMLVTERAASHFFARHRRQIALYCTPIACDVRTGLALYDYDEAAEALGKIARRARRVA